MKYAIIHVNDRAIENININKKILNDFDYIDNIEYFNGNKGNAKDVLNHKRIKIESWSPYDGRQTLPLPGELGIWVSTINVWEYVVGKNKEDQEAKDHPAPFPAQLARDHIMSWSNVGDTVQVADNPVSTPAPKVCLVPLETCFDLAVNLDLCVMYLIQFCRRGGKQWQLPLL